MTADPVKYRMLYWGTALERGENAPGGNIFGFFGELLIAGLSAAVRGEKAQLPEKRPQDFVRTDILPGTRKLLADILTGGREVEAFFGHAQCRICKTELGHRDLGAHIGPYLFIWPEKAEHYILDHGVWTRDCDILLRCAKRDQ